MHQLFVAALCLPLAAPQIAGAGSPKQPPVVEATAAKAELAARWQTLLERARPAPGPLGLRAPVPAAGLYAEMAALADAGVGPALAWCARNLDAAPAGDSSADELAGATFVRLVLEHGSAPWLLDPALDPLASLERAPEAVRQAAESQLALLGPQIDAGHDLALALRAAAIAPRSEPDDARRLRALELLSQLARFHPASPLLPRAERLAWRVARLSPGLTAPELAVLDVDGNQLELAHFRGRALLVDVWTTSDGDLLGRVARRRELLARFPPGSLALLGLARGSEEPQEFRRLLEELDLAWPTAFERAGAPQAACAWPLDGAPLTVLIDGSGVVRAVGLEGGELERAVARALASGGPDPQAPPASTGRPSAGREVR